MFPQALPRARSKLQEPLVFILVIFGQQVVREEILHHGTHLMDLIRARPDWHVHGKIDVEADAESPAQRPARSVHCCPHQAVVLLPVFGNVVYAAAPDELEEALHAVAGGFCEYPGGDGLPELGYSVASQLQLRGKHFALKQHHRLFLMPPSGFCIRTSAQSRVSDITEALRYLVQPFRRERTDGNGIMGDVAVWPAFRVLLQGVSPESTRILCVGVYLDQRLDVDSQVEHVGKGSSITDRVQRWLP